MINCRLSPIRITLLSQWYKSNPILLNFASKLNSPFVTLAQSCGRLEEESGCRAVKFLSSTCTRLVIFVDPGEIGGARQIAHVCDDTACDYKFA